MSSMMSTANSANSQELPSAITIAATENDIVPQTDHHTNYNTTVQAPINVNQNNPSNASDHSDININELNAVGSQLAPPIVSLEGEESLVMVVQGSNAGDAREGGQPQRISMHPKLHQAAVKGNLNIFKEFLQSQEFQESDGMSLLGGLTIGDNTVLHIAATSSSDHYRWRHPDGNHVEFAREVYGINKSLLMARNKLKETPLHCAVKAVNYTMVSLLISFAEDAHQVGDETLLTLRNMHGETALHEAVRAGHRDIVNRLILSEPRLTGIVDAEGVSPLYIAVMTNAFEIVRVFTAKEPSLVSCAGPSGRTALHAAVLGRTGITCELLKWDKSLATKVDDSKSTPLHYAASTGADRSTNILLRETSAAYIADNEGLYPIHVAARCGSVHVVKELIEQIPDSDELLDKDGRNFLHTAIVERASNVIFHIRQYPIFLRMLNARDYQGNTPLHLAGENGQYKIVRFLISLHEMYSSIMNRDGLTPVDLSMKLEERGWTYNLNKQHNILRCMLWTGALPSPRRRDHIANDLSFPMRDRKKDAEKAESATRSLGIISVLIATVTFAAIFTMPGGYIADDHENKGTPILSRKYVFKAFIVADLLAFALSILATTWLIYAGLSIVDLEFRMMCAARSSQMLKVATKATVIAFALATYTVLSHVNLPISIMVCVVTFGILPFSNPSCWGFLFLASPLMKRLGYIGLFKPHFNYSETCRRVTVTVGASYWKRVKFSIVCNLLLCILIFLLALI